MKIENEEQLEEVLSLPSDADRAAMAALEGDILILGVAGKMGPSLARRAVRAGKRTIGVARFSDPAVRRALEDAGVETIAADLLDARALAALPDAPNVIFMAGRKFGSTGTEELTWAMNALVPALVAERYRDSKMVAFSSGNVYPFVPVVSGGATESTPVAPLGEYAQSVLARERMFQYFSSRYGTRGVLLRLNYAIDLRYGVLLDIGRKVFERRAVDLAMGAVNVIWQGDANSVCLRALGVCQSPPLVLNLTGPETLSIRWIAERFGERFGVAPLFSGSEQGSSLLNNSAKCHELFGYPEITAGRLMEWTAEWISAGGGTWDKPTHFETRDGKF